MSNSGKKLSTFEFLFSLQKRTLLTEKLVQIALIFSLFFSADPKLLFNFLSNSIMRAKIQSVLDVVGA